MSVYFVLSVPVQVIACKDSSPKWSVKACQHWRQKSPKTETKSFHFRRQMDTNGYFLSPFSATFVSVFGDFCRQCGQAFMCQVGRKTLLTHSLKLTAVDVENSHW